MFSHLFRVVFRKSRNNVTCKIVDCSIERLVAVFTSGDKRNWLFLLWVLHRRQCRLLLLLGFNFYVSTSLSSPSGARWELSSYHTHYSLKTKLTGHLIISQSRILLFPSSCKFQNQKIFNVQILQAAGFREKMVEPFIGLGFLPLNWMISEGCQSTVKSCLCSAAKGQLLYLRRGEEVGSIIERKAEALSRDFTSRTFQKR